MFGTNITDINDERVSVYADMSENRIKRSREPLPGYFIAETTLVFERALSAGYEAVSFLIADESMTEENTALTRLCPNAAVYHGKKEVLSKITGYELTRGFLSLMERRYTASSVAPKEYHFASPSEFVKDKKRIVILDRVMNPTNLGSVFRTSAALGIDGIILLDGCADPLYRRALRVSMGNAFLIPWICIMDDTENLTAIKDIKKTGFKLAGMALLNNSLSVKDPRIKNNDKLAIVMGSEHDGISDEVLSECDYVVKIPMREGVDSLNVAVASSIALWELGIN